MCGRISKRWLERMNPIVIMAADGSKFTWQGLYLKLKNGSTNKPGGDAATPADQILLNCDYGDPTMFDAYWKVHRFEHVMVRNAGDGLSYFGESSDSGPGFENAELEDAVRALHALVGNAVTKGSHIVVGNGSTQLFQAALYALASSGSSDNRPPRGNTDSTCSSTAVVAQSPYYSAYPHVIGHLQSKLFHWAGDSRAYQPKRNEACIEVITSPNNPCGGLREGLVRKEEGLRLLQVHDLAYYWPTYMPITKPLDHDIMLFTLSKCTGHAGVRIGWAIVKDPAVAKKMAHFIFLNTIGVSHDAQSRAAGILRAVVRGYATDGGMEGMLAGRQLFHWAMAVMECRWGRVRAALAGNKQFSLPESRVPSMCTFLGMAYSAYPAFIWLKCEEQAADCHLILKRNGILSRSGVCFGVSPQYARLSLLDRKPAVDLLVKRLAALKC